MGISTSKTKTKQTPIVTDPMQQNLFGSTGLAPKINDFLATDPHQYVAPPSALQSQAFAGAQGLGSQQPIINNAISMAQNAPGITAPSPITAAQAGVTNWNAPQIGSAQQVNPVNLAAAHGVSPESLLSNLQAYIDPNINNVVNTTLANYDRNTGSQAASLAAQQARTGAFGGSRAGIAQGEFQADAGMNRAQAEAGLRSNAFQTALSASGQDADRRQSAGTFNANANNFRDITQGQMDLSRLTTNAGFANDFRARQAAMDAEAAASNAGAANNASMFNTGQTNQTAQFNSGQSLAAQQAAANQALQAAGLVGNLGIASGDGARSDLALTADLGTLQRSIDSAYLNAVPTQLQIGGSLYGAIPPASYIGANSVTKSNPGLFNSYLAAMQTAAGVAKSAQGFG